MAFEEYLPAAAGLGFLGAFIGVIIIAILIYYVIFALSLYKIAKKTKTENAWFAWIPILNIILVAIMAKKEWWWGLIAVFISIIPIIGGIASMVITIYLFWLLTERLGKPGPLSLLMLIPLVNLGYILYLAFAD